MTATSTLLRAAGACVLTLAAAASWADVPGPMSEDEFKAGEKQVAAQRAAELKACKRLADRARDLCEAQAKGRARVEKARLEARHQPSPDADKEVKQAVAEMNRSLAKLRCGEHEGARRKQCVAQAEHAYESAIRRSKVEKVEAMNALKAQEKKQVAESAR